MAEYRRILVAIEFLPSAHRLLVSARAVGAAGASIRLLHVVEWMPSVVEGAVAGYGATRTLRELHADSERQLAAYAAECAGFDVSTEVVEGELADTITDSADEWDADVVVVGHRVSTRLAGLRPRGVVERLLRHARRPILVVPA